MTNRNKGMRYYRFKLTTDFLNSDKVDYLISLDFYLVVLYQCLCLKFINTNGQFITQIANHIIPCDLDKLVRDLKYFTKEQISRGLKILLELDLLYYETPEILAITNFDRLIGSETVGAAEKRKSRG